MKKYMRLEGDRRPVEALRWPGPATPDTIAAVFGDRDTLIPAVTDTGAVLLVRPIVGNAPPQVCFPGDWICRSRTGALFVVTDNHFRVNFKEFE